MNYLFGFLLIVLKDTVYSIANIFDGELSRNAFKSVWTVVVLNGLLMIVALPVLYFVLRPEGISGSIIWIVAAVAAIEFFYEVPYYLSMRYADTSVVTSLFSFEKIFVPFFAFFIIGEVLAPLQYVGFAMIVIASIVINFNKKALTLNKAFYLMIPVTIILALEATLQKFGLERVGWQTFYFWTIAGSIPFYLIGFICAGTARKEIVEFLKSPFQKKQRIIYWQNIASLVGGGLSSVALTFLPVTIAKAFGSFHSVIVHLVSAKGSKQLGLAKGERLSWTKVFWFLIIGVGIILTIY